MPDFNRRDFLKLAGMLPLGLAAPQLDRSLGLQSDKKNVIIIVFDAFSAYNISLYGYGRETTPNITRLAERATVYHNHYAGSNFTTPGTASLLTGTYPGRIALSSSTILPWMNTRTEISSLSLKITTALPILTMNGQTHCLINSSKILMNIFRGNS